MSETPFEPTKRDWRGLLELQIDIDSDERGWRSRDGRPHAGYKVRCFQRNEAEWIKARLIEQRPDLEGRLFMSWLEFPQASERQDVSRG